MATARFIARQVVGTTERQLFYEARCSGKEGSDAPAEDAQVNVYHYLAIQQWKRIKSDETKAGTETTEIQTALRLDVLMEGQKEKITVFLLSRASQTLKCLSQTAQVPVFTTM